MFITFFDLDSLEFSCSDFVWPGGAPLTPGSWRFSYFYKYVLLVQIWGRYLTSSQRLIWGSRTALYSVNPLTPAPIRNMTVQACITARENEGLFLNLSIYILTNGTNRWGFTICCMCLEAYEFWAFTISVCECTHTVLSLFAWALGWKLPLQRRYIHNDDARPSCHAGCLASFRVWLTVRRNCRLLFVEQCSHLVIWCALRNLFRLFLAPWPFLFLFIQVFLLFDSTSSSTESDSLVCSLRSG